MLLPQSRIRFTPEKYLAFERGSETKHEYINGYIYAMADGSPLQNQICFSTAGLVGRQLKGSAHQGYVTKQCIRNDSLTLFTYPDIVVVFGEAKLHDRRQDVITNPKVIIEILRPVVELYDRSERFPLYQQIESLSEYVLIRNALGKRRAQSRTYSELSLLMLMPSESACACC